MLCALGAIAECGSSRIVEKVWEPGTDMQGQAGGIFLNLISSYNQETGVVTVSEVSNPMIAWINSYYVASSPMVDLTYTVALYYDGMGTTQSFYKYLEAVRDGTTMSLWANYNVPPKSLSINISSVPIGTAIKVVCSVLINQHNSGGTGNSQLLNKVVVLHINS